MGSAETDDAARETGTYVRKPASTSRSGFLIIERLRPQASRYVLPPTQDLHELIAERLPPRRSCKVVTRHSSTQIPNRGRTIAAGRPHARQDGRQHFRSRCRQRREFNARSGRQRLALALTGLRLCLGDSGCSRRWAYAAEGVRPPSMSFRRRAHDLMNHRPGGDAAGLIVKATMALASTRCVTCGWLALRAALLGTAWGARTSPRCDPSRTLVQVMLWNGTILARRFEHAYDASTTRR